MGMRYNSTDVDILVRDYAGLSMEDRVRAIKTTEHLAKILVNRDIGRAEQEGDIGTVYLHPRQCIMMLAQEIGAEAAPEIHALLRREEEEIRLDPRVITMQEVWAEEKLSYLSHLSSWVWYSEPSDEKLGKEQLRVARSLAHLYGHNWAWAMTGRPPHEYGKVVKSVKRPRATTADIYRHTVDLLGEDGYGLNLPINFPEVVEGNVVHQTGTGRLTWLIRPDGSVQLTVSRPAGWVLRAELGTTRPRKVVVVRNPAVPLHRRHIEALERPIKRLAPRWTVPAAAVGPIAREGMDVAEAATQEAYDKGRRDERERIVRLLQEMYARHYQMARQERDRWVRMAHYEQAGAIEEAIRHIEEDRTGASVRRGNAR